MLTVTSDSDDSYINSFLANVLLTDGVGTTFNKDLEPPNTRLVAEGDSVYIFQVPHSRADPILVSMAAPTRGWASLALKLPLVIRSCEIKKF